MHWYIPVTQIIISLSAFKIYSYIKNRSPINVINGITLPDPNDNRWKLIERNPKTGDKYWTLQMENIRINRDDGNYNACINIDNVNAIDGTAKGNKYINKTFANYFNKVSMRSIQETKFLELE